MDRRTFVLLTGAASFASLHDSLALAGPPPPLLPAGQLRFTLGADRRWSLSYLGLGTAVPLIPATTLTLRIGDRRFALADLDDIAVGTGRPPDGRSTVVRGKAGGAFVEVVFWTGPPAALPAATVGVRVYPDTEDPPVTQVEFADLPAARVLAGSGDLTALVSGYQSWNACRVEPVPVAESAAELQSHFLMGLARRSRALGLAFEPGDAGEGRFTVTAGRLIARSDILPGRPTPPGGERAGLRIMYAPPPRGELAAALEAAISPSSEADRERLAQAVVPAGWCSWYQLFGNVTQDDMVANLELAARHFDARYFRYIQLDDGFQRAAGDWDTNAKFPAGHRWLTDRIKAKGLLAGLWVAPFAVADRSGIPEAHPDWLLADEQTAAPIVFDTRDDWGGRIFGLDAANPGVQAWLKALGRQVSQDWGYDYLKIDFLYYATRGARHFGGATHAEAYRAGLRAIRDGLGPTAFLLGCGAPLQQAVGLVDGMRIGPDVDATWGGVQAPARAAALRAPFHRTLWLNDPDCLLVRPPLTEDEARAWASVVAASGGMNLLSDHLPDLPAERIEILQRTLPVSPVAGRPLLLGQGGGGGGWWSLSRDRAPGLWLTRAREDWWTLTAVNWDDEPATIDVPLPLLGISAPTVLVYDVWRGETDLPVTGRWRAEVPAHACRVVGLRPRRPRPQILGTSRHVIQGVVDIAQEEWKPRERALAIKSVNLDRRPYDVTLAVPGGYRVAGVDAPVAAKVWREAPGVVRVTLEPGDRGGGEVEWSVRFSTRSTGSPAQSTSAPRKR